MKSRGGTSLLDVATLISITVLAAQYFLNNFMSKWITEHLGDHGFVALRVFIALALLAAVVLGAIGVIDG